MYKNNIPSDINLDMEKPTLCNKTGTAQKNYCHKVCQDTMLKISLLDSK